MTHTLPLAIKTRSAHLCYRLVYPDGQLPSTTAGGVDVKDGDQQKSGADSWSAPKLGGVGAAVRFECKRFKR